MYTFMPTQIAPRSTKKQRLEERFTMPMAEKQLNRLRELAGSTGESAAELARQAIDAFLDPPATVQMPVGIVPDSIGLPYLQRVPCGPLAEAFDSGETFAITQMVADELEMRDGDFFVRADGFSMEGAGIQDGFLILMRPLNGRPPRRGEIALVQVVNENGDYEATVKHWHPGPKLTDGEGNEFTIPEGTVRVDAVATAKGVIGRV